MPAIVPAQVCAWFSIPYNPDLSPLGTIGQKYFLHLKKEAIMFMIFFVLDDPDQLFPVLDAWEKAGIPGATIIESTGLQRVKHKFVPMRFAVPFYTDEVSHQTLMAIVENEVLIQAALEAAESIVGDLNDGRTGVFAAWPLTITKGLKKRKSE